MINIENTFEFKLNDTIIIGCSSGPDSMALVDMLLKIREKYQLLLVVAHINHNVRMESYEEAEYLKNYCVDNNILFETMVIDEYGDDNFHNEARNIRYNFFETLVKKYNADYLMTAHHGDDLIETVLMRIVRGSNLSGYSGFKKVVVMDDYKIVRPLINFTKEELEKYDLDNDVKFFVDSSNDKDKYTRNRYRKYVIPFLKVEDKDVHQKFLKFSEELSEASRFIDKERDKALERCLEGNGINLNAFLDEDPFIQKEILYYVLSEFYQDDLILVNDKHITLLFNLINNEKPNSFVNLPNEVVANKSYNMLELKRETLEITSYEIEFDNYVLLPDNHVIEKINDLNDNSNNICRLNSTDVELPLIVRSRKIGDRMKVKGMDGSKKVKDIFINAKVKLNDRDSWPIVIDSKGNIVWIPGIKKSIYDRKKADGYDIILKYS